MEKEFIEYVVRFLVDDPDSVVVNVIEGEKSIILELSVASDDIGRVIGKNGRVARSLRTLLSSTASKGTKRVALEILD